MQRFILSFGSVGPALIRPSSFFSFFSFISFFFFSFFSFFSFFFFFSSFFSSFFSFFAFFSFSFKRKITRSSLLATRHLLGELPFRNGIVLARAHVPAPIPIRTTTGFVRGTTTLRMLAAIDGAILRLLLSTVLPLRRLPQRHHPTVALNFLLKRHNAALRRRSDESGSDGSGRRNGQSPVRYRRRCRESGSSAGRSLHLVLALAVRRRFVLRSGRKFTTTTAAGNESSSVTLHRFSSRHLPRQLVRRILRREGGGHLTIVQNKGGRFQQFSRTLRYRT